MAHCDLSACRQGLFALKPTDSSSKHHQEVLCSGLGGWAYHFLPL